MPASPPPPKPPLKVRLRYKVDTTLSRGTSAVMGWLAVFTALIIAIGGLVIAIFGLGIDAGESVGVGEGMWQTLLRLIDAGTFAGDAGWPLRIVAFLMTLGGIFLASSLIGLIATAMDQKIEELRKGRSLIVETGHTVVLGWSPRLFTVLEEIVVANENLKYSAIAILADRDKTEMEDTIRDRAGDTKTTRVVCRTGDPADPSDLALVNVAGARSVIVLADESRGDAGAVKSVLAVLASGRTPDVPIVVELSDRRIATTLSAAAGPNVLPVLADEVITKVTAQACHQSGLSTVFRELLDFDGDELYFHTDRALAGKTFGDVALGHERSVIIGLRHADGRIFLAPPTDTVLEPGDAVIAISADDDTVRYTGAPANADFIPPPPRKRARSKGATILLVGWSDLAAAMVVELDQFLDKGTVLHLVADGGVIDPVLPPGLRNSRIEVHLTDNEAALASELVDTLGPDQVILLGYRTALSSADADARTLLTLLTLRRAVPGRELPPVIAEVLDPRDVDIAQTVGVDDFVVSDELSSLMISQLAEHPELGGIFDELFDVEGVFLDLHPAEHFVGEGRMTFAGIASAVAASGSIAIGFRDSGDTVRLNIPKSEMVTVNAGDQIVVLGPR